EIPCGLVADSKSPLNLIGRDPLASFYEQQNCHEPRFQRQMRVVKDRLSNYAELVFALATFKLLLCRKFVNLVALAAQALNTQGPAQFFKKLAAPFICRIERIDFGECHG